MRNRLSSDVFAMFDAQMALITRAQASAAGLGPGAIRNRVRRGEWVEAQPGVFRLAGVDLGWRQQTLAAVLATGGRAAAAQGTALAVLGVRREPTRLPVEVLVAGSALPLLRDVIVHRTRRLESCDVTTRDGVRTTTGARTLVDLAAELDDWQLVALLDEVIGAGATARAVVLRRAQALRNGRTGVGRLVTLTAPGGAGVFRSWLERYGARLFAAGGLPPARWNHQIRVDGRLLGIADAYWPRPVVAELDGAAFHSTPRERQRDRERDRRFLRHGIPTFRFSYEDLVQRPQAVVDELGAALAAPTRPVDLAQLRREAARSPLDPSGVSVNGP